MKKPEAAEFRRVLMKLSRAASAVRKSMQEPGLLLAKRDARDQLEELGHWIAFLSLVVKEGDAVLDGLRPSTHAEILPYLSDMNALLTQAETVATKAILLYGISHGDR